VEVSTVGDGGSHGAKKEMLPQQVTVLLEFTVAV
jgi:hypothetical protein